MWWWFEGSNYQVHSASRQVSNGSVGEQETKQLYNDCMKDGTMQVFVGVQNVAIN